MTERITITFTRYAEPNDLIRATIDSLAAQRDVEADILFLDQQNDAGMAAYLQGLATPALTFRYVTIPARSLSYARNRALEMSAHDVVLFIDSDAVAEPDWARELAAVFDRHPDAAIAGGRIYPRWHRRPLLITRVEGIRAMYSIIDHGDGDLAVGHVVGANFAVHRARLGDECYFDEGLGRRDGVLLSGEEVDLCKRAIARGLGVIYAGRPVVHHQIGAERIRYAWILRRLYYQGLTRGLAGPAAQVEGGPAIVNNIWYYLFWPLHRPLYVLGYLRGRRMLKTTVG